MEKSGLMPVECVMASCENVIWRAYRAPAVVLSKKINVSNYWKSDILAASVRPAAVSTAGVALLTHTVSRRLPAGCTASCRNAQSRATTRSVTQSVSGAATDRPPPEVPEHPSFQEYCRVCMTKIRGVEEQMRESVAAKDLEQLEHAIEIGTLINVVSATRQRLLLRCSAQRCF
jgi:hypothetical protein